MPVCARDPFGFALSKSPLLAPRTREKWGTRHPGLSFPSVSRRPTPGKPSLRLKNGSCQDDAAAEFKSRVLI